MLNKNRQQGVFSIEMAFVLLGMGACLYFCFDLGYQQIRKSQLERVSYSLVSLLKERSLFYSDDQTQPNYRPNSQETEQLQRLAARFLNVKTDDVSVIVESRVSGRRVVFKKLASNVPCELNYPLNQSLAVSSGGKKAEAPIYQVTVCQIVPAWFERIVGNQADKNDRVLSAHSTFVGR